VVNRQSVTARRCIIVHDPEPEERDRKKREDAWVRAG